jgi:hypothetical protein
MAEILLDEYVSPDYLAHHARIDQYQIYSLIIDDYIKETTITSSSDGEYYPFPDQWITPVFPASGAADGSYFAVSREAKRTIVTESLAANLNTCVTFQSFDPSEKIPIDFASIAKAYQVRYPKSVRVNYWFGLLLEPAVITEKQRSNYHDLITGKPMDRITGAILDSRLLPVHYKGVAASTRKIKWGYYRRNELETHPSVKHSLDWLTDSIAVKAGQSYHLPINNPVLGTLVIDDQTAGELLDKPGDYPLSLVRFGADLNTLINTWDELYSDPGILEDRPWADGYSIYYVEVGFPSWADPTYHTHSLAATGTPPPNNALRLKYEENAISKTRILAANNDVWGHGAMTADSDPPVASHPLFQVDDFTLFYKPNADGSIGSYIMDSPRILEIHQALDAGKFALDDLGQPRVTNLGWYIERLGWFAGLRRQKNGDFLTEAQAKKYKRTRLNKPDWPAGQYSDSEWGNLGMAIPYLPTAYENGQRQDNQWDLVHDLPQMLQALHDQIDASQGIQHNGEIRLPVGGKVQSYPNQGAMLTDLAMRVIELQTMAEKMLVMDVETSNSVRELFAGIGIPVASKSVPVQIGGKTRQIYYPAFQAGKGSILDRLTALAQNIGIVLGALMPRNTKNEQMNPFERKPK